MGSITTAMCNSFKQELLGGVHDLDTDTLNLALIKASPTDDYGAGTESYDTGTSNGQSLTGGNNDEATATQGSYAAQTLDSVTITLSTSTGRAYIDIDNEVFSTLSISADGALIYNASKSNRAIAVFNFGSTVTSTNGDFTVVFPDVGTEGADAVIRIS
jgi:hypothetical protein